MNRLSVILALSFFLLFIAPGCDDDCDNDSKGNGPNLTSTQFAADFDHLVHMVNKYYGPIEWKEEALGEDLLALASEYRTRVIACEDYADFFDTTFEYVSHCQDGHTGFYIPSTYIAYLNFDVDIYEEKVVVDKIWDYTLPFEIGDEIVSMDGVPVNDLVEQFKQYQTSGFDRCSRRWATTLLTNRYEQLYPHVVSGPVSVRYRKTDGTEGTVELTWNTSGSPYIAGKYEDVYSEESRAGDSGFERFQKIEIPGVRREFLINFGKYGHRAPTFSLPDSFEQRLGTAGNDEFYSGTYTASGKTIGFLRVPKMYVYYQASYQKFQNEIIALESMTDGLVIDITDNPGGQVDWCNFMSRLFHREPFPQILFQIRPTIEWIQGLESLLYSGISPELRAYLEETIELLRTTYESGERLTPPVSLDSTCFTTMMEPAEDVSGNLIGYSKPIVILINELSISGGDYFPATMQDSGRATLVGYRTAGGGGHVVSYDYYFPYSEAGISLTGSLMYRYAEISAEGYPDSHYIENVGVHPDYFYDFQNIEDLLNEGEAYVDYFTTILLDQIENQ